MTDALFILHEELTKAEAARAEHRKAGRRGNVEASIAAFQVEWLKRIIRRAEPGK